MWQRFAANAKCSKADHTPARRHATVGNPITTMKCERQESHHVKSTEFADVKPKKKCCRSKPRCKRCPLVLHRVHKAELNGLRGKELEKVFKRARKQ